MIALFVPVVVVLFAVQSLYRHKLGRNFIDEFGPIETNVAFAAVLVLGIMTLTQTAQVSADVISKTWLCAAVLMPIPRFIHSVIQKRMRRNHHFMAPTLIVGSGQVANRIIERLQANPEYGLKPVGHPRCRTSQAHQEAGSDSIRIFRSSEPPIPLAQRSRPPAQRPSSSLSRRYKMSLYPCCSGRSSVQSAGVGRSPHVRRSRRTGRVEHLGGLPLLALPNADPHGWQFTVKHIMDRAVAASDCSRFPRCSYP